MSISSEGSDEQTLRTMLADVILEPHDFQALPANRWWSLTILARQNRLRKDDGRSQIPKEFGGAYRDRTDDPLLAKQMLSQLS
jgi:hypothetical protein